MRRLIAQYVGYPIQDLIKGTSIISTNKFLEETQYWTKEKIKEYQFDKFKKLISYAYENVSYYSGLLKTLKLAPSDFQSFEDIQKIPLLTKEIARKENFNLISNKVKKNNIKIGKTGGTTGVPLLLYKDIQNRSYTWASYYRWYKWMGIETGDPEVTFWGSNKVLKSNVLDLKNSFADFLQNKMLINSFAISDKNMIEIIHKLNKFKPKLIKGYLSALLQLAEYMIRNNVKLAANPIAISTTTETLLPPYRRYIEEVFNCPVYDQYGCGEVSAIAFECSSHVGLHVTLEHVYVEVLDLDENNILNHTGKIIATDLDNYVMPFIRYETGDLGSLSEDECPCGVNQPLLKSIDGRAIDTIILANGAKVHGVFFTDIMAELGIYVGMISRFQVYQDYPGNITFRLESNRLIERHIIDSLKHALDGFFNNVDIVCIDKLQNDPSGKFRYIISDIK